MKKLLAFLATAVLSSAQLPYQLLLPQVDSTGATFNDVLLTPVDNTVVTTLPTFRTAIGVPAGNGTLTGNVTVASGKILAASNTLTLAGIDGSTLDVGIGGTLGSLATITPGAGVATLLGGAASGTGGPAGKTAPTFTGGITVDSIALSSGLNAADAAILNVGTGTKLVFGGGAILRRTLNDAFAPAGNGHGYDNQDYFIKSGGYAYAAYAASVQFGVGTSNNYNHLNSFQSDPQIGTSGTTGIHVGLSLGGSLSGGGTLTTRYGAKFDDMPLSGGATMGTQYGYYAGALGNATTNWAFYSLSAPSFFGGAVTATHVSPTAAGALHVDGSTTPLDWGNNSGTQALLVLGNRGGTILGNNTATGGGTLWINTPSYSTTFASGLGVDGVYAHPVSTVRLIAYGVNTGGGFGSHLSLSTTNGTVLTEVARATQGANFLVGTTTEPTGTGGLSVAGNATIGGAILGNVTVGNNLTVGGTTNTVGFSVQKATAALPISTGVDSLNTTVSVLSFNSDFTDSGVSGLLGGGGGTSPETLFVQAKSILNLRVGGVLAVSITGNTTATQVTTFSSTVSGTSATAAAIKAKSLGLSENLYVGGNVTVTGNISSANIVSTTYIKLPSYIVSGLPSASTAGAGAMAYVTDSTATAITGLGLAVIGSGSNKTVVVSDGTNWIVQ